jgi:hypothetical protein
MRGERMGAGKEQMKGEGTQKDAAAKKGERARKGTGTKGRAAGGRNGRIAAIRASTIALRKALEEMERAREAVEGHFRKTAAANMTRSRQALETLGKAAVAGPLLDVRRLERDLASLVEACGEMKTRKGQGRKRDVLAVDDLLRDAARRLEGAVADATAHNVRLLLERLSDIEAIRHELQGKVNSRFSSRLERCKNVLVLLDGSAPRLGTGALASVARELDRTVALGRKCHPAKLGGNADDLYLIDGFLKQAARRLERVAAIMAVRSADPKG